jgi:2-polyprenyl-3-methyl-5-hydroxy-6-metoxy-1,4-benzoquinol methylase
MNNSKGIPFSSLSSYLRWNFAAPGSDTVKNQLRSYYRNYYQDADRLGYVWKFFDQRSEVLTEAALRGIRILDVGCGLGTNLLWACLNGAKGVGLDVLTDYVQVAEERREQLEIHCGRSIDCRFISRNLFEFEDESGFDMVFLQEAFHHIEPRQKAVEMLAGLVRPGGKLVFQETNAWNPLLQVKLFKFRGIRTIRRVPGAKPGESYLYGDERILTPRRLTKLFRLHGFQPSTRYFRLLPSVMARSAVFSKIADVAENRLGESLILKPMFLFYEWMGDKRS